MGSARPPTPVESNPALEQAGMASVPGASTRAECHGQREWAPRLHEASA